MEIEIEWNLKGAKILNASNIVNILSVQSFFKIIFYLG